MYVLLSALMWTMPVGLPYALAALALGRVADAAALGVVYVAVALMVMSLSPPEPLGAEPSDVPHLTLCHPHGVNTSAFTVLCAGDRKWSARRRAMFGAPHFLAAVIFPFADIWTRCMSCRCSSPSRASMTALMRQQRDLFLYPGGFVEAARHSYHRDVVGRGAIRLALVHGYAVRVCHALGERETAYNLQCLWSFRVWLAKRGVPSVVPLLRLWARAPRVAFSPTIQLPRIPEPTRDDVERWHGAYVAVLRAVHAAHKRPTDELVVYDLPSGVRGGRVVP
jgi:hypothetical protein